MHKALLGQKLAVLVANGFCEKDLTEMQRGLMKTGANVRIVGMDVGLVNSWNDNGWGLNFAADQMLNEALGADFSMLVIPGGQRSVDKLKLTAHTRRFIGSFLDARKPVVAFDHAVDLLVFSQRIKDRTVTGPAQIKEEAEKAGAIWADTPFAIDGNLMTGGSMTGDHAEYVAEALAFLTASGTMNKAA
ncbi:MAG: DJ-1/PfpI family protein [Alphaproteobacteria bacterium]